MTKINENSAPEAQGEAPQPSPLVTGKPAREWGMTNKEQNARNLAEQIIALYHAVDPSLRNQNYSAIVSEAMDLILEAGVETGAHPSQDAPTRFDDFDDDSHPFRKWWEKYGQFMLSGGGRRESIWAARGWIAREQLLSGKEVTGDALREAGARSTPSLPAQDAELDTMVRDFTSIGFRGSKSEVRRRLLDWRGSTPSPDPPTTKGSVR